MIQGIQGIQPAYQRPYCRCTLIRLAGNRLLPKFCARKYLACTHLFQSTELAQQTKKQQFSKYVHPYANQLDFRSHQMQRTNFNIPIRICNLLLNSSGAKYSHYLSFSEYSFPSLYYDRNKSGPGKIVRLKYHSDIA